MNKPILVLQKMLFVPIITLVLISCAASTGSRYDDKEKNESVDNSSTIGEKSVDLLPKEDFDIAPYKSPIDLPEKKTYSVKDEIDIWFEYGSAELNTETKSLVGTAAGYRVLVLTTDNPEEANQVKTDIYFGKNANEVYVDFEPPFYKVKAGDFDSQKNADDFRFKLNQLGYKEAKVIKEKINIYK